MSLVCFGVSILTFGMSLAACVPGPRAMPPLSPALLPDNLLCRTPAGDKTMTGTQGEAIEHGHWHWLKRMSSDVAIGTTGEIEMEVDPTVYYEAFISAPVALADLHAEVVDGASVVARGERNENTVDIHWSSATQSHWTLRWGYSEGSIASACIYMLAIANKK